jgi:hypothetical protein
MSRATVDVGDGELGCSLSNGNAIITGSNCAAGYIDKIGPADMHAIRVGAISRGNYSQIADLNVFAA